MFQTFVPRCWRARHSSRNEDRATDRQTDMLPFSVTKDSTIVRVSFTMPSSPSRPWSPLRRPPQVVPRKSGASFGLINESGCLWFPDDDVNSLRHSTLSGSFHVPPMSAKGTFLKSEADDDSIKEIAAIPLSRFNSHQRHWSVSSTTTTRIWSEGRPVSGSSSFRRSDSRRHQTSESVSKWSNVG
ncbi:hypothetical protein BD289DRAFT_290843 [Coniella lustricola]|uniref:Uncharacterized protein n=1 Tax=Coniella lustricola TaxID=2025994 RepID=A0A2T3A5H2_9PEZI|nr:hypothetical protein BD289DRAFT_290843 [Coniella lustricola]